MVAHRRGRTVELWFLAGLLLGPFGILFAFLAPSRLEADRIDCPYCTERIKPEARICPHCRSDLRAKGAREASMNDPPAGTIDRLRKPQ